MSARKGYGIIAACTLAMMNNIGTGPAIAVALPDIGRDLNISAANLQWIISAYSLTSVCFFRRITDISSSSIILTSFSFLYRSLALLPDLFTTTYSIYYVRKKIPNHTYLFTTAHFYNIFFWIEKKITGLLSPPLRSPGRPPRPSSCLPPWDIMDGYLVARMRIRAQRDRNGRHERVTGSWSRSRYPC